MSEYKCCKCGICKCFIGTEDYIDPKEIPCTFDDENVGDTEWIAQ